MDALMSSRQAAVGLDDIADVLAGGPPVRPASQIDRFWAWVDNPAPPGASSLRSTLHHLSTFWEACHRSNVVLLRYEDMKADLEGQMRALSGRLGIAVADGLWPELVDAATFDRMRERSDELVPNFEQCPLARQPAVLPSWHERSVALPARPIRPRAVPLEGGRAGARRAGGLDPRPGRFLAQQRRARRSVALGQGLQGEQLFAHHEQVPGGEEAPHHPPPQAPAAGEDQFHHQPAAR